MRLSDRGSPETPDPAKSRDGSGRPRSAVADASILEAATELFCELGYEGLSFEGVAADRKSVV